jgi:DNA repair photolyase
MGLEDSREFEEKIYSKADAAALLRNELRQDPAGSIAIGTATDPYQPAERVYGTTRSILETLAEFRGLQLSITTKSDLVTRDIALLREIASCNSIQVNMSITTLDTALARKLEPRAPRPDLRLAAVRSLADGGIDVAIFAMPVVPGITDSAANLAPIARAGAEAGARTFHANVLFLASSAQKAFFPFLDKQFPQLASWYRQLYCQGAYLRGPIVERIQALARRLRQTYYPNVPKPASPLPPFGHRGQLCLFDKSDANCP